MVSLRSRTLLTATPPCAELQSGAIAAAALALPATARTLDVAACHRALCATLDAALEAPGGAPAYAAPRPHWRRPGALGFH